MTGNGCSFISCFVLFIVGSDHVLGQRLCSDRPPTTEIKDVRDINIDATVTGEIEVTGENNLTLYAIATWTADLSAYTYDIPLDGYAVRLRISDPSSTSTERITSNSVCVSNPSYIWVNTTDDPNCRDTTVDGNECEIQHPGFCRCPSANCSALEYGRTCKDIKGYVSEGYETVPETASNVRYPVQFNERYQFDILPYSRLYANKQATGELFDFNAYHCMEYLKVEHASDIDVARRLCCESGAVSALPYGVQQTKVVPIFKQNVNETTVNVTITWFPPDVYPNAAIRVNLRPLLSEKIISVKKRVANSSADYDPTNCSSRPTFFYETVIYDLDPGPSHIVDIQALYEDNICNNDACTTTFSLNAEVPEDLCQGEFRFCVAEAVCSYSTGVINATCICNEGYFGDGRTQGSGCQNIDMCKSPDNICSLSAVCTDLPPPSLEMSCHCTDGFYGDGLRRGSGCESQTTLLLATLLPILFILILAAIITTFLIRKRSQARKNEQLQRFITDLYAEEGILTYYQDPGAISIKQQTWQPTFGKKWELDRNEIQFENVLGRGNYGIVYKGYLCSEKPQNGGRSNGTGEFYDLVKTNETYAHIDSQSDDGTTLVAIKCLQESIHSHENLLNFLAEISFMLNLGDHDNIVKVHGCSTTENPVFMVMEYLCYGNLLHFLWDAREPSKRESDPVYNVTELSLSTMVKDVAQGMGYLQQIRVIHGDIAARNIVVGENGTCKLSDFGLSSDVYRYGHIKQGMREIAVPLKWTSPERMMNGRYPITTKSDVWSYGNLLYEVFTLGCAPYPLVQASDLLEFLKSGNRMEKPNSCSDKMYELMTKCWRWRASSRPSFTEILSNLENIVNTLKSQKQAPAVLAVEELDKELYEQELKATMNENGGTNSDRAPPHYENVHATESEL